MTIGAFSSPLATIWLKRGWPWRGRLAHPADPRQQALKLDLLAGQLKPALQGLVLGSSSLTFGSVPVDVLGVTRQRDPTERPYASQNSGRM